MWSKLEAVYRGKKIFLTGHTGFKGSWLLKLFSMLNAEVKGYALMPQNNFDLFYILRGGSLCNSIIGDLRDKDKLTKEILEFQPDFIFHLAAQPLVRLSYQIPVETFEVNVIGTANLLDAIRQLKKPCCSVMITTDKVYHNNEWVYPYRENDRLGGYDPYSASKACTELVIDSFRSSFFNTKNYIEHGKAIAVGRAGNVIGGGDWAKDRLIPDIIRALEKNIKVELRNPNAIRPWQHVLEPLLGYVVLGTNLYTNPLEFSGAYNFGPDLNDALPVNIMADMVIKYWGTGDYFINQAADQPHEAGLLKLDVSKAINTLGWRPKLNADQAIKKTVTWYKEYFGHTEQIIDFTAQQITDFING